HPGVVAPGVAVEPADDRRSGGWQLAARAVGICLVDAVPAVPGDNAVFVGRALTHARDEALPDARALVQRERHGRVAPALEVADDRHRLGVGRPHREARAGVPAFGQGVRAQLLVDAAVRAFGEQVDVDIA